MKKEDLKQKDPPGTNIKITNRTEIPGPTDRVPVRPGDISLPGGYRLDPVVTGLTYPTSVTFDDSGNVYVGESGYSYGPAKSDGLGRILRVEQDGSLTEIARGFRAPMTGMIWHRGCFYVAEGAFPGSILRVGMDGSREVLVRGLRSGGDHFTTDVVIGPDGMLYFGVGTFTNSAVVGFDNFLYGWLADMPKQHDVPCRNIVLRGINYKSIDPFALILEGEVRITLTGAFKPFGTPSFPGETIAGHFACNGVIYRCYPDTTGLEIIADGFRNPFGIGFSPAGRLYAIDQGYDNRGSRPIAGSPDPMWEVIPGGWYGWPDFAAGEPVTDPKFKPPNFPQPQFVLAKHPPLAGKPVINFIHHSASMKFDFSTNPHFGFVGEAFVAQFGSAAPVTGRPPGMPGFKVVRADLQTRQVNDFLVINKPGPGGTGPARPVSAKFDPSGRNLYLVDFGILEANLSGVIPWARSGGLWRICPVK